MGERPHGTVTFLYNHIVGSFQLWQQAPAAMPAALERYRQIWEQVIAEHSGWRFKHTGEGVCAAFNSAPDALLAALSAQRALQAEAWPTPSPLLARTAIHTGTADLRAGEYYGPALDRAARLLDAAHGGQTLLSLAAQELVRDALPPTIGLRDLGEHRLRDLTRPEHIFQLLVPDLPADFPPPRTLDAYRHNLPAQPNALVGRERQLAEIGALLRRADARLLTLTGPGGVGKTRLALQSAADMAGDQSGSFADGVMFVELGPIGDPALVASAILRALGLQERGELPPRQLLIDLLRERAMLLVLDNFEQVLDAAGLVGELLAAAPRLKVLVTSRAALRLYGEREYPVPPLDLPEIHGATPEHLAQYDAVRLFIERAVAARPDFAVTNENAPALAEICVRLDGLPLAIELAAARVRLFTPQALLARLGSRLATLTGGARDMPARQQTLRAAIAWSYDLLATDEQALFARLAVFVGGFGADAAEAVCAATLDQIEALASQSLLLARAGADGEPRFVMLETVREYAFERLAASREESAQRERHAAYFLAFAEQAEPELDGPNCASWLELLEINHDNLRAALAYWIHVAQLDKLDRLGAALGAFWPVRGYLSEGRRWLVAIIDLAATIAYPTAPEVHHCLANLAMMQGDFDRAVLICQHSIDAYTRQGDDQGLARAYLLLGTIAILQDAFDPAQEHLQQSWRLFSTIDDTYGKARALNSIGSVEGSVGRYQEAHASFQASLALSRKLGATRLLLMTLHNLGWLYLEENNPIAARSYLRESMALAHQLRDEWNLGSILLNLGYAESLLHDYTAATHYYLDALTIARELGDKSTVALLLDNLSIPAMVAGDYPQARQYLAEASKISQDIGAKMILGYVLNSYAILAVIEGKSLRSARLAGSSEALFHAIGSHISPSVRAEYERHVTLAGVDIADAHFTAAYTQGRALSLDQALAYALEELPESAFEQPASVAAAVLPAGLSEREAEVLRLVATGLTNAQVAERLVISPRTVNAHLNNLYAKIGLADIGSGENRRAAAVRFALTHGLA